ncbi:hypothetical protein QJS66_22705 [Kocuria rhizophila]|nr:hypothetical protein QJS66_22705 [Kocuria rhizophila]
MCRHLSSRAELNVLEADGDLIRPASSCGCRRSCWEARESPDDRPPRRPAVRAAPPRAAPLRPRRPRDLRPAAGALQPLDRCTPAHRGARRMNITVPAAFTRTSRAVARGGSRRPPPSPDAARASA